jgi:rhodanese-related sulfurtransferase
VGTVDLMRHLTRILALAVVSIGLVGPSCSSGDEPDRATSGSSTVPAALMGPDAFAEHMDGDGVVAINVHVPDEGSIKGTDLTIPFDEIEGSDELPSDRSTPLAVYCRSGNMSADAVRDLAAMGYTDVAELNGGFDAWVDAGRSLDPAGS